MAGLDSMLPSRAPVAEADRQAQMVRYESLFAMTESLTLAESLRECAAAASTYLKYIANVSAWRVLVQREEGFLSVAGCRGETESGEFIDLEPWDARRWETTRPRVLGPEEFTQDGGPPPPFPGSLGQLQVLPFARTGQPRCLFIAGTREPAFSPVDAKFLTMAGSLLCDQISAVVLRRQMIRALQDQAWRDGLTGMSNRRSIMATLEKRLSSARDQDSSVCVMLSDIDHFKVINDTYGHIAGDEVLRETARRLTALTREGDHVGRYGGEEFLFVLDHCTATGALHAGQRVRAGIEAKSFSIDSPVGVVDIAVTMSVGAACCRDHPELGAEQLIKVADEALYLAKKSGRNRVGLASADQLVVQAPQQ